MKPIIIFVTPDDHENIIISKEDFVRYINEAYQNGLTDKMQPIQYYPLEKLEPTITCTSNKDIAYNTDTSNSSITNMRD